MKKSSYSLLLLCTFSFCYAQEKTTYTNERGEVHLCGPFDINELEKNPLYASWYTQYYDAFKITNKNYSWSKEFDDIEVEIYMGTWCWDSKIWVPRFIKIWDMMGLEREKLHFIALYDIANRYKKGPNGEEKGKKIYRIPTFIFKRDGKEIGRIVETPQNDLLTDIDRIALGLTLQSN